MLERPPQELAGVEWLHHDHGDAEFRRKRQELPLG